MVSIASRTQDTAKVTGTSEELASIRRFMNEVAKPQIYDDAAIHDCSNITYEEVTQLSEHVGRLKDSFFILTESQACKLFVLASDFHHDEFHISFLNNDEAVQKIASDLSKIEIWDVFSSIPKLPKAPPEVS